MNTTIKKSFLVVKQKIPHHPLVFNNANIMYHKHLGTIVGSKLTFENQKNVVTTNINKTIGILHKIQSLLPRTILIPICRAFV